MGLRDVAIRRDEWDWEKGQQGEELRRGEDGSGSGEEMEEEEERRGEKNEAYSKYYHTSRR